ncbi:phage tail spike protein [Bacillus thuringiensis]|uniref:phage tail spike protein n=1 Tax=Bacillus thuringiensis TaxID=1428 RepID=UPI00234FB26B|nr:phage tail spike protein [Bacillus thuringiensis]MDC7732400.1 tail fiber domain-containing protein [Bacillus thuringiensis]HDR8197762.1 phage tail protein [Bacillus thuringiensis]
MSTPSGDLHVVDFKTNQIVSAVQPKDYWDDKRHWEIKNNIDTVEFRVFENTDHAATLVQQNLVLKEVRGGRIVPYVVTETEKDSKDRSLMVYASGEWIQLAKAGIIEPQKIESKTLKQCMEIALKGTKWKIGKTEHDGAHSMVIEEFTDPLDLLKKIAASFELEIQYRAEVVGSKIVGRYVDMVQKRGRDTRKEVTFGKDLIGIKRIENSQSICTALLGFVKKENGEFITISSINKGVPYLVDDAAYQRWNENGKHKFAFYTPQTDNQNMSPERLLTLMKTEMSKLVNASVSYGVDAQNIARIPGLSHEEINEGDTIRIIDEGFTPKLYLEARAIAGDESFKDPTQDNYVFGDYREIVDQNDELRRLYQKILSSLYDKVPQELFDQLNNKVKEQNKDIIDAKDKADQAQKESQTAKDLAETTRKYLEQNMVDIIEQPTAPTENLRDGKTLWIDSSDPENKVQKLWKGGQWQRVTPDTGPLKQSIKDVKEDIETAKTELNQKVQGVVGKAQEIAGQIVDVQKQVNNKVDQTWINNKLKDKADKSGVYTKDEIKDGFIGKQVYETDKQGNVQNFKDINTSIGQTNEALKQKAEKSELTKTNDGLTKLQNKTNEIETTANGTKQKLSELETTVDNTNVGVRNYVLDSDKFLSPPSTMQSFKFVNDLKDLQGKQVTLSVYVEIKNAKTGVNPSNRIGFEPSIRYSDNSIQHLGAWLRITDGMNFKGFISATLWIKDIEILKTEQNAVYIQCGGDYVKVGRPKIEIGNKVTDWTPAPEDQVTTTDFTKKTVEIGTTIKGINTTVSNVQNEQGKLTERVTKSEQTADGFKTSIESLTKKDTEISNKLNTVEQTVEGTKKTITDIQSDTSGLKKTTTEIKEQAGKTSEKLESVEKKFDDMKFSGRNLLLNTGGTLKSDTGTNISNTDLKSFKFVPDTFEMIRGQEVALSITARTQAFSKGTPSPWIGMELSVTYEDNEQVWLPIRIEDKVATSQGWVRYTAVVTIKNKAIKTGYLNSLIRNVKGTVELKEWQIEIGNKATEYRPAAEDQVTTDEFTKKTTEIEKSVDGVKTTVSTVQKDQGTMQTTLNQVKQTTDSNAQTITTLSQTQGKQGEIIQQNTSDITQLNNQIKSKVSETQMQNYVGGLGSTNMLLNTAFEKRDIDKNSGAITSRTPSFDKWIVPAGVTVDVARHHDGYNSTKIEKTGQTDPVYAGINQIIPVTSRSGVYVYSAWFYTDNKSLFEGQGGVIKMQLWNGNTALDHVQTELEPLLVNGSWVFVSVKLGMPNKDATHIRAEIWVRKNGRMWVSQPMLQQGSTPSTFMENPKDIGNYDALVGEIAKKVATNDFNNKVNQMETTINQQSNRIDLKAEATNVYTKTEADGAFGSKAIVESHSSQLSVMSNEISTRIKAGEIASAINQTAQAVLIQARKIYLDGYIEAKHLRAQELVGITIKTAPQGSNNNHIRLNAQDMTLYGSGANRAYLGFMETPDGSIQPSLVLGSDNIKYRGTGSFYIYQVMPRINGVDQPSKAYAKFGVSKGENAEGTNIWSNYIQMQNDGGHLSVYSDGQFRFKNLNDIIFESEGWAPGYGKFIVTTTEPHYFKNNYGEFHFDRKSTGNSIYFANGVNDHDLNMGRLMLRTSLVSGYDMSLQIKDVYGNGWRDIELRTLRAQENVNANGQMWAKAFNPTSARNMKENIKDIPFSALDKIMSLAIKQYNFKDDMYDLYQMRVNKPEEKTEPYTTKEIETYFGMIADDTDAIFTDKEKRAINLYNTVSILIAAFQQQYHEFNEGLITVKGENKQLKEQVATLTNDMSTLTELVQKLINGKPEQP